MIDRHVIYYMQSITIAVTLELLYHYYSIRVMLLVKLFFLSSIIITVTIKATFRHHFQSDNQLYCYQV